ncbi:MAG: porin [Pseudomonadota bacterium]
MKKKLLMAAVGAALVAGPMVAAHAAGATLYGHLHLSMDRFDSDIAERGFMANNSSRFGFKGDEDLGGGLKAIYQAESGIFGVDEGGGFGGTLRNTFVGFAGSWGAVKLGRHDTPYKDLGRKLDNFNEQVGDMRNIIGNGDAADGATTSGSFDQRVSNMIRYESPNFAGLNVVVQHTSNNGAEAGATGNTALKDNSLGVNWSSGPLFLGAAWNERGTTNVNNNDESGIRLAGSYTMDAFTIGLLWESLSDIGGVNGADRDAMGLAASMKMGNNKFKFHWLDADKLDNAADTGGDMFAIGVDHTFSKTAMVYLNYASVSNDTNASFQTASGVAGHGDNLVVTNGRDANAFSAGYILKF